CSFSSELPRFTWWVGHSSPVTFIPSDRFSTKGSTRLWSYNRKLFDIQTCCRCTELRKFISTANTTPKSCLRTLRPDFRFSRSENQAHSSLQRCKAWVLSAPILTERK